MANGKSKLELTWIGKENQPRLEPRILIEDPAKSYGDKSSGNMLIHGDNLLALKALEQDYAGKVKCIYVDPPFNTGQAMKNYEDGLEHSIWLSLMRDRFQVLHRLLAREGTLAVHIDDNELGYLIVLLDEIFGRSNRVYIVTFKQGSATGHKSINPGCVNTTNYILLYTKDKSSWIPNRIFTGRERDSRYGQFILNIDDSHEDWRITTLTKAFATNRDVTEKEARKIIKDQPELIDKFVLDNAKSVIQLARPDYDAISADARNLVDRSEADPARIFKLERQDYSDIYLIGGKRIIFYIDKLKLIDGSYVAGEPLTTLWDDILSNNLHAEGGVEFPKGKKPEGLIKRVFELASNPGDLVLDSFLGSGTTAAVAHKMGRRWIGIELGDHCDTHCLPRLKKVVDGADPGGITEAVGWQGGGGFKYYYLAPSILNQDPYGNWIINKKYNPAMLAAAVAKHEGFTFNPDPALYWKQGRSTEKDFIFTTTEFVTQEHVDKIHSEMADDESLLICCKSFNASSTRHPNITIKKIPNMLLGRCEFGKEDYSLNIVNMPMTEDVPEGDATPSSDKGEEKPKKRGRKKKDEKTMPLFDGGDDE